jgi:hypothetical protein
MAFASISSRAATAATLLLGGACSDIAWVDVDISSMPPRCGTDIAVVVHTVERELFELDGAGNCTDCFEDRTGCTRVDVQRPCECYPALPLQSSDLERELSDFEARDLSGDSGYCLRVRARGFDEPPPPGPCDCAGGMVRGCAVGEITLLDRNSSLDLQLVCAGSPGFDVSCSPLD